MKPLLSILLLCLLTGCGETTVQTSGFSGSNIVGTNIVTTVDSINKGYLTLPSEYGSPASFKHTFNGSDLTYLGTHLKLKSTDKLEEISLDGKVIWNKEVE